MAALVFALGFFTGFTYSGNKQETTITSTSTTTLITTTTSTHTLTSTVERVATGTATMFSTVTVTATSAGSVSGYCFSASMQCDSMLIQLIRNARGSILVAVYSFTNDRLSAALIEAASRGVSVKVVIESEQASVRGSEYERLKSSGVAVRLDGNPALMHHKFMVIDNEVVVTGSYNWSISAEDRNDENFVVLRDAGLARLFVEEFDRIWSIS